MRFSLSTFVLALFAAPSLACTAPTEYPYVPTRYPSDLVIEGIATSAGQSYANVSVSEILVGAYASESFRLEWWIGGGGMCDPPGPDVRVGQKVRIYLIKEGRELRPLGWVLTNEIPKSRLQIQADQGIAQEKAARQERYFPVGGALSFNDPKDWLKIEDIPELQRSKFPIFASFNVAPDGTMSQCESGHVEPHQALDLKACNIIKKRARLVPPKFPEETLGSFDMYPPEPAGVQSEPVQSAALTPNEGRTFLVIIPVLAAIGGLLWWRKRRSPKA